MIILIKFLLFISMVNANWNDSSVCVDIPTNFTLCSDIGYKRMKLPNLLNHDTLAEMFQQAQSWIGLYQLGCSPNTKLFLCSILTPVCLEQTIPPCRSLCESVKTSCLPQMAIHGFPWPRIADCKQYPLDNNMCISPEIQQESNRKKNQANNQLKTEQILNQFCQSDWVLKVKGTLIVNNLNETATLHVHNYTVIKGNFENNQQKILPVFVNDLKFWNQLLTTGSSQSTESHGPERLNRFNKRSTEKYSNIDRLDERFRSDRLIDKRSDRLTARINRPKSIQTFKKYTFILFGRTTQQLNGQSGQKLTLFFPLTNKLPYLKKLYYKKIRSNQVDCEELELKSTTGTKSNLESILYFESNSHNNQAIANYNQFNKTLDLDV